MKLVENVEVIDKALFLYEHTLIISDTHIGCEEALQKQGILIPRFQSKDLKDLLQALLDQTKPKKVIINGDFKHEFGTISQTEWRHALQIIDLITSYAKLTLIRGNHDTIIEPITKKRNVSIRDYEVVEDIYVCHGHEIHENKEFDNAKTLIIGHEHPAVTLKEGARSETYKCYLKGNYKRKQLIVQPSFNPLTDGTDILKHKRFSPYLCDSFEECEVYVVADAVRYFGKIKDLQRERY